MRGCRGARLCGSQARMVCCGLWPSMARSGQVCADMAARLRRLVGVRVLLLLQPPGGAAETL